MIWVLLLIAGLLLAFVQRKSAAYSLNKLHLVGRLDHSLAQPNEVLNWMGTVENNSRLPVLFSRLKVHFPTCASFEAEARWIDTHCRKTLHHWYVEEKTMVLARHSVTKTISFSLPRRGLYTIGDSTLSAGDLLGFHECSRNEEGIDIVVMPSLAKNVRVVEAVGGFLGDISVKRFIMEDPILTVGFRDYTGREPMKAISWSRTASAGSLQVKQYDHTAEQTVMVLLDTQGGSPEQLEGCFRIMRSVCEQLERRKIPFGMRTNGSLTGPVSKLFSLPEGLGGSHLNTILYALGRADYACFYSPSFLTKQALRYRKKNESYIFITPKLTQEISTCRRMLQEASGYSVCLLTGSEEVEDL